MDTISLSRTVLEIMPVKILNSKHMMDFDLLKVKVKNRFFSIIEKAHSPTKRRRLRYCAWKLVQSFRLYLCQRYSRCCADLVSFVRWCSCQLVFLKDQCSAQDLSFITPRMCKKSLNMRNYRTTYSLTTCRNIEVRSHRMQPEYSRVYRTVSLRFPNGVHRNVFNWTPRRRKSYGLDRWRGSARWTQPTSVLQSAPMSSNLSRWSGISESTSILISRWKHMWPELPGPASTIFVFCDR